MNTALPFLIPSSWDEWKHWSSDHSAGIIGILAALVVIRLLFHSVFARILRQAATRAAHARREAPEAFERRAQTLLATLDWVFTIFLTLVGAALILDQFDVQVSALIAGVGVAGVAIGLGMQTLIRDVVNGVFILLEGQYAVGDTVSVAGVSGDVVEINPRRTVVRDIDGNIHFVPNSAITVAVNRTPSLGRFRVEVEVPLRDSDRAIELADATGGEVVQALPGDAVGAPRVADQRVSGESGVWLIISGEARPARRWQVESEYRRRLKRRFDAEHIEVRFEPGGAPKL